MKEHRQQAAQRREEGVRKLAELGWTSADALRVLQDRSEPRERREQAAEVLGNLGDHSSIPPLIDALAEGELFLAWTCSNALIAINSHRHGRRLIRTASKGITVDARQAAIYAIWLLGEKRGSETLIHIGADLRNQTESTRLMAVEALCNTNFRRHSQQAVARHLFDSAEGVKYSALCALCGLDPLPEFIQAALREKLNDPGHVYEDGDIAAFANDLLNRSS